MEFIGELWMPIVLSAVFVFIASTLLHMVIPVHKNDYKKLPGEAAVLAALLGAAGVQPGEYMFPCAGSMKEAGGPEMMAKYHEGPVGWMTIMPSRPINMGKSLLQWFVFSLVVSLLCAYVAHATLAAGTSYLAVFRVTGVVAIMAYAVGHLPDSIWKGHSWTITGKFVFDGVVYGLVTAGTFGWLWPAAVR